MTTRSLLLQAFEGTNKTVPVWFMRQAGRYLPQYRALKEKYSLEQMFSTPELASQITCQPIEILGVDAAILFADILTLPAHSGFEIHFSDKHGPVIEKPIDDLNKAEIHDLEDLSSLKETIGLINQQLPKDIPLIGFAGSPFTVLTYLVEGGSSVNFSKTFRLIETQQKAFHKVMGALTKNTIGYLNVQRKAGIKVFQLFDTLAGILRPTDYAHWVLPYVQEIFKKVDLPSIYFLKNCNHLLALMDKTDADFLSVCHTVVIGHHTTLERTKKGIQGNLFPGILYSDNSIIEKEVNDILIGAKRHGRFIFNLSHGVLPDMDMEKLKFVVNAVHSFRWGT